MPRIDHDTLQDAYQRRKRQHKAPARSRDLILARAKKISDQNKWGFNLWNWTVGVTAACGLAVLYQAMNLPQDPIHLTAGATTIETHQLPGEKDAYQQALQRQADIANAYQNYANSFLESKQLIAAHHRRQAVLVAAEHGWQLQDCDQANIYLTDGLVKRLSDMQRLQEDLRRGDNVEIFYDEKGRILQIRAAQHPATC